MIEFGHSTHVGLRREHNEDTYYADADLGVWLVADGMGGHEHGEVASAIARDTLVAEIHNGTPLTRAVQLADEEIIKHSNRRSEALPMGTTIATMRLVNEREYEIAWVGDSRVYLWNGALKQISQDHSYVQELIDQGAITVEQARSHPHRNVVTLTEEVGDAEIAAILARTELSAQECVDQLVLAALDGGGADNVTVILVRNR
jgi:PPM family protein phosphatase